MKITSPKSNIMKLAKKYSHYIARTDAPAKIIPCTSLEEATRWAQTETDLAHYADLPDLAVCERDGTTVARMHDGRWIQKP
jgi:hypothetical protein